MTLVKDDTGVELPGVGVGVASAVICVDVGVGGVPQAWPLTSAPPSTSCTFNFVPFAPMEYVPVDEVP